MKIRLILFLFLLFPPLLEAKPLQDFVNQAAAPLAQETGERTPILFYLERPKVRGQLARWDRQRKRFYLSKTALKNWLKQTKEPTPELLARCLAPLYEHEKLHAENDRFAQQNGFVWPLTLADEVLATARQVAFMRHQVTAQPEYYQNCSFLTPMLAAENKAATQQDWSTFEAAVLARYARLPAQKLPPPPFTPEFIRQAQTGKITYGSITYKGRSRGASVQQVFSAGRPWTEITTKELQNIDEFPSFNSYQQRLSSTLLQVKKELLLR